METIGKIVGIIFDASRAILVFFSSPNIYLKIQKIFERVLRKSVEFAIANRESSSEFVKCHAQEMETEVIDAHINLYVNEFSVSLGEEGRRSVEKVFEGIETKNNIFL